MAIGTGIALAALGAILAFAVDFTLAGVDIQVIGVILMVAGVAGIILGIVAQSNDGPPPPPRVH